MAGRSTRTKLRYQADMLMSDCDTMIGRLKTMNELAHGRSEVINRATPDLVKFIDALKEMFSAFKLRL